MTILKKLAKYIIIILIFTSCNNQSLEKEESTKYVSETTNTYDTYLESNLNKKEKIGNYKYPKNPAKDLRDSLQIEINNTKVPLLVGELEKIEFENKELIQFKISFDQENKNECIIYFVNKYTDIGYEETLDGNYNPSFTMAFKEENNSEDMILLLSYVIKYLSPDLSFEEAKRLAIIQDKTISTDGYSMPKEIEGYQIQAQYKNPHIFTKTKDFDSKFGVNIRALKQLWISYVDLSMCKELVSVGDFELLNDFGIWDAEKHPEIVYGDFLVKNIWHDQSYIHGETWVVVDVESSDGNKYSLVLDTWEYPKAYEFGVGQKYTMFIRLNRNKGIIYAIQISDSDEFNKRGEAMPIDYPNIDWRNPLNRIEPEAKGNIFDVYFILKSQAYNEKFAALEGYGIGEKQWPPDPVWDGYDFMGWYDNAEYKGNKYSKDTPIYKDTYLQAKWKYSGLGGVWPRDNQGRVRILYDENMDNNVTIIVNGYNMALEMPKDQRFRWYPVAWRLSDDTSGDFSEKALNESSYEANVSVNKKGKYKFYVTYAEEIFDGSIWQTTNQTHEVMEHIIEF